MVILLIQNFICIYIYYIHMVITSLQEKQNRKFYVPIRPGNRGGWSLFQWQSVREMPYRDRQMYLGNSAVIGVLDKGGKWRKRDWYLKTQKKYKDQRLKSEQEQAIRRDMQRMNTALGVQDQEEDDQKFTEQQLQQLLKKVRNKNNPIEQSQDKIGLGFDKTKVQIRAKPTVNKSNANRLQGYDDIVEVDGQKIKKQKRRNQSGSEQQRSGRKLKKQKKQKKHKRDRSRDKQPRQVKRSAEKEEEKRKNRQRSRSRSNQRKNKKEKHKKQRDRSRSRS